MVIGHRRPPISPSPSREVLQSKLTKLVSRHEQMKISYLQLKSQIDTGLHQAEEVFASLSIPLIKLVGLKTVEMASEDRFTTIVIDDNDLNQRNGGVAGGAGDRNNQISAFEGENFAAGAAMAGKEIIEKRKVQFVHLVKLLRQIESQVNSSQDEILQNLENHHGFLQKSIQKSIGLVSTLDSENHDTTVITDGVGDLIQALSHQMCNPMLEYAKGLKDDMKNGACVRLLAMANEMEKVMTDGRIELEDARKKARLAEEGKIEALCKLKETVRRVRKLSEHLTSLSEPKRGLVDSSFSEKFSDMEEDRTKDDKLLWGVLKKKRKFKVPESPLGPEVLLYFGATKGTHKRKQVRPLFNHRPARRSCTSGLSPKTPLLNSLIPLGSSPSAVNQPVTSFRHTAH
ncbi:Cingulin [Salix suchowensis]|nr:Cingulin [Salix suchowensis]